MSDQELVELAQDVDVRCRLRGDFVVRSGAVTHEYFDKYLFEADPVLMRRVVDRMVALVPAGTDMLGGLELGGVPLVTILSVSPASRRCSSERKPKPTEPCGLPKVVTRLDGRSFWSKT